MNNVDVRRPGDFVAFKLDIDTESIEQALMKQIAEDESLFGMISEMFFEQHHNGTEVSEPTALTLHGPLYHEVAGCQSRGQRHL